VLGREAPVPTGGLLTGVSSDTFNLKGLSHEIDLKSFDKNLQNLAYLRDAAGF
jgi:hypothetical protein